MGVLAALMVSGSVLAKGNTVPHDKGDPSWYRYKEEESGVTSLVGDADSVTTEGRGGVEDNLVHDSRFASGYTRHYGVDVAYYDNYKAGSNTFHDIDWNQVRASGRDFAMIRMGYRTGQASGEIRPDDYRRNNRSQYRNLEGALNAGMKTGVYFFSQATTEEEAVEEAQYLLDVTENYRDQITLPYVMDYEFTANKDARRLYDAHLSKDQATACVNAFAKTIADAGEQPMLYVNSDFMSKNLDPSQISDDMEIWVARWTNSLNYSGRYTFWQYSDSLSVPGIPAGSVDGNVWYEKDISTDSDSSEPTSDVTAAPTPIVTKEPVPTVTVTPTPRVTPIPTAAPKPEEVKHIRMYRVYNGRSGEHFYTKSAGEKNSLVKKGWRDEGTGWYAPEKSDRPVYRLYNPNAGDHHYTMNRSERDKLVKAGWRYEGVGWYSAPASEGEPLYRQYNSHAKSGAHNYTMSRGERNHLVSLGWRDEGVAWYGFRK